MHSRILLCTVKNVYREVIDPPLGAQQNTVEGRVSMWNERSLKRFTCNDEAWMLLVLEDNWCVWYNKAVDELSAEIRSLSNKEFMQRYMEQGFLQNRYQEGYRYSQGVGESRKMNEKGFDRLEALERRVQQDRLRSGAIFMEALYSKYRTVMGYTTQRNDNVNNVRRQRLFV